MFEPSRAVRPSLSGWARRGKGGQISRYAAVRIDSNVKEPGEIETSPKRDLMPASGTFRIDLTLEDNCLFIQYHGNADARFTADRKCHRACPGRLRGDVFVGAIVGLA